MFNRKHNIRKSSFFIIKIINSQSLTKLKILFSATMGQFSDFLSRSKSAGYIPEMEQVISQLERGTLVTKYSWKKKAERKTLAIRRETGQITWIRPTATPKNTFDGAVNIREIKEIRPGKNSKDFEKCLEDTKRIESQKCFVVFYGSEFKLRSLSISG